MYTDEQLLDMIQHSEKERNKAFRYFFSELNLEKIVIHQIRKKGGRYEDAKDAFQDGCQVFYRHLMKGNFKRKSKLTTYFISICNQCWFDKMRLGDNKNVTLTEAPKANKNDYTEAPDIKIINEERKSKIRAILDLLGQSCYDVIMLGNAKFSSKEIKEKLQLSSEAMVKKTRFICMKKLRELLKKNPDIMKIFKSLKYNG